MSFLYSDAAEVLVKVLAHKGTVKSATFSSKARDKRACFKLITSALSHSEKLVRAVDSLRGCPEAFPADSAQWLIHRRRALLMLMIHDLGYSKNHKISGGGALKRFLLSRSDSLLAILGVNKEEEQVETTELKEKQQPETCFVRINTLLIPKIQTGIEIIQKSFPSSADVQVLPDPQLGEYGIIQVSGVGVKRNLATSENVLSRKLILQDKPSTFPPIVLNPDPDSVVIDACAAPGNKTSLLSALMNNKGTIFAFDRDNKRSEDMRTLLSKSGVKNVEVQTRDFLEVTPDDIFFEGKMIDYILLDPSCSGSGIIDRQTEKQTRSRVLSLARFQLQMLRHALSFGAKRVVYSTCSINHEENEEVVVRALSDENRNYHLEYILPDWKRRGDNQIFEDADRCVRVDPKMDKMTGFFVACFVRNDEDEQQEQNEQFKNPPPSKRQAKKRPTFEETPL